MKLFLHLYYILELSIWAILKAFLSFIIWINKLFFNPWNQLNLERGGLKVNVRELLFKFTWGNLNNKKFSHRQKIK